MKKILISTILLAIMSMASSVHAYTVIDGWQLDSRNGVSDIYTTDIGHLAFSGGISTVTQEVDPLGNPYVGAKFKEFGNVFSLVYIPENQIGSGDSGAGDFLFTPTMQIRKLELVFSGLSGSVTSFDPATGGIDYKFDVGVGDIFLRALDFSNTILENLAEFDVAGGSGGTLGNFKGVANTGGTSNVLGLVNASNTMSDLFRDSFGNSLDALINAKNLFLEVNTTNSISNTYAAVGGGCDFDGDGNYTACATIQTTSEGAGNLLTNPIPEPESLALLGIGMLGLGVVRRRSV